MKTALKKFTVAVLCAALLALGIQQVRAHWILYVCVAGGTAIIGGITYVVVKSCQPKYYCITDADGNRFYSNATRSQRAANEWTVTAGPYNSAEEAAAGCVISTNGSPAAFTSIAQVTAVQHPPTTTGNSIASASVVDEVYIPSQQITIWRSADLKTWEVADRIMDDPTHFSWVDTNAVSSAPQMFYRVSTP